ncbi:DUF2325 domain-containing protein [Piscibacillus sp. B03]|uniref:DUF2325 domain-containing protein n=1 Tax=Piscibacillus sp. B03 TaxID=3457430 RepID=UPI003FCC9628
MMTIGIIGGSQENTFKQIGKKHGCKVLFHSGKDEAGRKKSFKTIVKQSDCVVVLLGAVGHVPMELVKELCKKWDTDITFVQGFGATGAIQEGMIHHKKVVQAA